MKTYVAPKGAQQFHVLIPKPLEAFKLEDPGIPMPVTLIACEVSVPANKNYAHHVCEYHDELFFVEFQ